MGQKYKNQLFTALSVAWKFQQRFSIANVPQTNGLVERAIKEQKRHLKNLIYELNDQDWPTLLPLVMRIVNNTYHSSIGCTPRELVFPSIEDLDLPNAPMSGSDYADKLSMIHKKLLKVSIEHQNNLLKKHGRLEKTVDYNLYPAINSKVLYKYPGKVPNKLLPKVKGPYIVVAYAKESNCVIIRSCLDEHELRVHVSQIVPYYSDNVLADADVAAKDTNDHFDVERIINHRIVKDARRHGKFKYEFLVKWFGFSDDNSTWESFENVKDLIVLDQYLDQSTDKNLLSYVEANSQIVV